MSHDRMSGESRQDEMRQRLVHAAALVLATQGAAGFSARRVTAEAGTSTMAVYTHFGSMEVLLEAVVTEGFRLLETRFLEATPTDDPLRDVAAQTNAYVDFAVEHRDLYGVMFGTIPLGQYQRTTPEQLHTGRTETLDRVGANLSRAVAAGRLGSGRTSDLAFLWWSTAHGYALLETSGHIRAKPGRARILIPLVIALFTGLGDDSDAATSSVTRGFRQR